MYVLRRALLPTCRDVSHLKCLKNHPLYESIALSFLFYGFVNQAVNTYLAKVRPKALKYLIQYTKNMMGQTTELNYH